MLRYLDTAIGFAVVMLLLSLLITTLVQSVVAAFNLRGNNLKWGLELLLGQIEPGLSPQTRGEISETVLMHPAVAAAGLLGRRRRAVAIRVEELFRVLRQIGDPNAPGELTKGLSADTRAKLAGLVHEPLIDAARIDQFATDLAKSVPQDAVRLRAAMVELLGKPGKVVAGVSDWFDTIMDRTTQRFTMHTRWLSVAAALLLTMGLRLDTPGVLNRIWSSGALREQLVAAVPEAMSAADTIRSYELRQRTLATRAILAMREEQKDEALRARLAGVPDIGTHGEGAAWLAATLAGRPDSGSMLAAYRQRMTAETDSLLRGFAHSSQRVRSALADPAIGIFQTPLPAFGAYWWDFDHVVRGLVSVVLLSLGAPFWYNGLQRTANLRPVVATKVAEETKAKSG
jgi:hypothetical protein